MEANPTPSSYSRWLSILDWQNLAPFYPISSANLQFALFGWFVCLFVVCGVGTTSLKGFLFLTPFQKFWCLLKCMVCSLGLDQQVHLPCFRFSLGWQPCACFGSVGLIAYHLLLGIPTAAYKLNGQASSQDHTAFMRWHQSLLKVRGLSHPITTFTFSTSRWGLTAILWLISVILFPENISNFSPVMKFWWWAGW